MKNLTLLDMSIEESFRFVMTARISNTKGEAHNDR